MILSQRNLLSVILVCFFTTAVFAQKAGSKAEIEPPRSYKPPVIDRSIGLQAILDATVNETLIAFAEKNLKSSDISATVIDLRDAHRLQMGEVRGNERIYPASVVKMFYMAALQRQIDDGKVKMTDELRRGLRDMIVDSSNEATQYIFDVITGTASGGELPKKEFDIWQYKRNRVNRYFASLGYSNINVNQKTFCEDAYGIEQQTRNYKGENRNMLTTNATARLLAEIVLGRMGKPETTLEMMDLMKRDPFAKSTGTDNQATGFTGKALIDKNMMDAKLWSKAGWTSKTRHDAAYIETAVGDKFVLVIYTENHATEKGIIPAIAGKIIDRLTKH